MNKTQLIMGPTFSSRLCDHLFLPSEEKFDNLSKKRNIVSPRSYVRKVKGSEFHCIDSETEDGSPF